MITAQIKEVEKVTAQAKPLSLGAGVPKEETDPTVPEWAKQSDKPTYTASEVGAIPVPSTATVGQTIRVSAVDESGKPTEWEAVNFPEGGGGASGEKWEKLNEFTLEENAISVLIDADADGNPFSLKKMRLFMYLPQCKDTSGNVVNSGYTIYNVSGKWFSPYTYPSSGWHNGMFIWTIEVLDKYMFVECLKHGSYGETQNASIFHKRVDRGGGAFTITSFLWQVFNANVEMPSAMAGATFEVWGVRA